jgi:hypothetical protein
MKDKYLGKTIEIFTPFGRLIHKGKVFDVINNNVICLMIEGTDIETAVYLDDGIKVNIIE